MNNQGDIFMNDTLDHFQFTQTEALFKKDCDEDKPHEITLNDSCFLSESFGCEIEEDLAPPETKETTIEAPSGIKRKLCLSEASLEELVKREKCCKWEEVNLELSQFSLPEVVLERYSRKGIVKMFSWQVQCLNLVKNRRNIVYSAPTSAGKTLVAEVLAVKTLFERQKKVLFVLPFVSIVREKMYYFQDILGPAGIRVEGYMGSYNPPGGFQTIQFAICTIEKANSLINRLMEEGKLEEIGAILVDEVHLLGDSSRGYLLELMLTKLRYISLKNPQVKIQIIAMSATLPNLQDLSTWLDAELYTTTFRPIPLQEMAQIQGTIYDSNLKLLRKLEDFPEIELDTDYILQLCLETIQENCSVLIFCPTKQWCESLAIQISTAFFKLGLKSSSNLSKELRSQLNTQAIMEVLEQLQYCPVGLDKILCKTVSFGVAFHHAGLTMDERDIIEAGFRKMAIRVLVATSTLSSGVNLPARRVIIRTPNFHGKPLEIGVYKQMIGRAGRMGKDSKGESILICQENQRKIAQNLFSHNLNSIKSCLKENKLKRAILEVISSGVACSVEDLNLFLSCTFLQKTEDLTMQEPINFLLEFEFIKLQKEGVYQATNLGRACLASSLPPEEGLALFSELEKARRCFVLETELHLIYLVTPFSACNQWGQIDWMFFLELWEKLPQSMRRVGKLVGISEAFLFQASRGNVSQENKLAIHKRFFVALALQDLVNERPLIEVCRKFSCNRGMLQSLQLSASTFAGMVTSFSRQLGWSSVELLIGQFQDRLQFGVSRDLLDLMRLPILNGKIARTLYNAGLKTLVELANSSCQKIEEILLKVQPFESEKQRDNETKHENIQRNKLKNVWITGREGLTELQAAEILLESSRKYLQIELGLKEANWEEKTTQKDDLSQDLFCDNDESALSISKSLTDSNNSNFGSEESFNLVLSSSNDSGNEDEEINMVKTRKRSVDFQQDFKKINIVNVCAKEELLKMFFEDSKSFNLISLTIKFNSSQKLDGFAVSSGQTIFYLKYTKDFEVLLKNCLRNFFQKDKTIRMFDVKTQLVLLSNFFEETFNFDATFEDPKIANWLLEPDGKPQNLAFFVCEFCPELSGIYNLSSEQEDLKLEACVECFITWHIQENLSKIAKEKLANFDQIFDLEMLNVITLTSLELNGIPVDVHYLQNLVDSLKNQINSLEKAATSHAGRRFALNKSKEIAKVLGITSDIRTKTSSASLEKLDHPIAQLITQWRSVSFTLLKIIYPLIRAYDSSKIFGSYYMFTATGRITMQEPNIQSIPKDYEIINPITLKKTFISCRSAFKARKNNIFLSADYRQLELRILAHLSEDEELIAILRSPGDVITSIASNWNKISEAEVDESLRQKTKQLIYGIIYGMGSSTLAEKLGISQEESSNLMQSFYKKYPGIKNYFDKIVKFCEKNEFITTLSGRKRFLHGINSEDSSIKGQATRQAVHSTVQGSAADIVKKAMALLNLRIKKDCLNCNLVLHLHDELMYEVPAESCESFTKIVREIMENATKLLVPLPVKCRKGPSWGQLTEF